MPSNVCLVLSMDPLILIICNPVSLAIIIIPHLQMRKNGGLDSRSHS